MAKSRTVTSPVNMGLYLDRPHVHIPDGGMYDCQNVGIRNGKVRNDGMGWTEMEDLHGHFTSTFDTEIEILHLGLFKTSDGTEYIMAVTELDVMRWDGTDWQYVNTTHDSVTEGTGTGQRADPTLNRFADSGIHSNLSIVVGDWIYILSGESHPFTEFEGTNADDWYRVTATGTTGGGAGEYVDVDRNITESAATHYTVRHQMGFTRGDVFDSTTFLIDGTQDDHWVLVNGVDGAMWSWNPDDTEMIDRSQPCAAVAVVNNILLAAGAPDEPTTINYGVPGTPFTFSSNIVLSDTAGALVRLMPLYDGLAAYCEDSIHILTYVGGDVEFTIRTAISDRGLYAPMCLLDRGNYHEFISRDGLYRFDGVTMQRIHAQIFDPIVRDLHFVRIHRAFVLFDENYSEAYWAMPAPDDPGNGDVGEAWYAYVVHEAEPAGKGHLPITKKLLNATCGLSVPYQQLTLFGTVDGEVMSIDGSNDFDGSNVSGWATFARRPVIDGNFKGVITRVEPFTEDSDSDPADSLSITLFIGDFVEENISDMTWTTINLNIDHDVGPRFASFREAARYYSLRFQASANLNKFAISGFATTISPAGER